MKFHLNDNAVIKINTVSFDSRAKADKLNRKQTRNELLISKTQRVRKDMWKICNSDR